jgi:hypothetical protein
VGVTLVVQTWRATSRASFALFIAAALAGCGGSLDEGAADQDPRSGPSDPGAANAPNCTSLRDDFAREVWARVLGPHCVQCHAPGGVAAEQHAALQLLPSTYPGFLDANLENAAQVAKFDFDGQPLLLQKPLGKLNHGGGAPLREDSEEQRILARFVSRINAEQACATPAALPEASHLVLLDAEATFRKASLQLADRLPSDDERARLRQEGEAALPSLLEALMKEEAFIDRVIELYNDQLLTDFYLRFVGAAVNLLSEQDYPGAGAVYGALEEKARVEANLGIAREPLWIIANAVRNDLPFSEILTANYTMVNAGSAAVYATEASFADPSDPDARGNARVAAHREAGVVEIPHAGLLTTPAFLNRFPTSPTNRNRHRARKIYEFFLATDILKAADRPIDPLASTRFNNPTRDDVQCNGCHRQLDPIAGAFMKWSDRDQERYEPDSDWYPEMFAAGFGREVMDTADYTRALPWLAQRIVADPRFVLATIHTVFRGLTGQEPLDYPRESGALDFDAQRVAWQRQDASFRAIGERFVAENMRFKTVVRELLISSQFRAVNAMQDASMADLAELAALGTGRLSTPERLAAKIEVVTGVAWARDKDADPYLKRDFHILYGGIDSDTVTKRLTQPNGTMASVAARMANEVSCRVTAWDFTRPRGERRFFAGVEPSDVPEAASFVATPAADSVERIRGTLQHLHELVLGERLQGADPELDRSYALFVETFREGVASIDPMNDEHEKLPSPCRAQVDLESGMELPAEDRIDSDPNHTIRAWMAVLTYLLSDYRFLYEP